MDGPLLSVRFHSRQIHAVQELRIALRAGHASGQVFHRLDGVHVALLADGHILIEDVPGVGKEVLRIPIIDATTVNALAFTRDGKGLFVGAASMQLWEFPTGKRLKDFGGHRQPITSLALSPDGKRLASASQDGTILVWDVSETDRAKIIP